MNLPAQSLKISGYQRSIAAIFSLFAVILLSSCVENLISIQILPDGTPFIEFTSRGDSTDIFDRDFSHPPSGLPWSMNIVKELVDDSDVWSKKTSGHLAQLPDTVFLSDSPGRLNHFLKTTFSTGLFATRYNLNYTFKGRRVYQKYPLLGHEILNDFQGDSTVWLPEVLNYVLSKALNDMSALPSNNYNKNFLEHLENHFKNYFSRIQYSQQSENLSHNTRSIIMDALQPFQSRLTPGFTDTLLMAIYPYEIEFETTINLYDDHFRVLAMLPGTIATTNADSVLEDTLIWNFSVGEILNDDLVIQASSVIYLQTQIQKLALGLLLLIGLTVYFISRFWKKKKL